MYALRHSSIVRMLLRNVPIRLVASLHNTSVAMIERTLFEIHHRAQRRHLSQGTAATRAADRQQRRRDRPLIRSSVSNRTSLPALASRWPWRSIKNVDNCRSGGDRVSFSSIACSAIDQHETHTEELCRWFVQRSPVATIGPTEADAFSIAQFCQRHGISIAMYYKMRAQDPKSVPRCELHAGTRRAD